MDDSCNDMDSIVGTKKIEPSVFIALVWHNPTFPRETHHYQPVSWLLYIQNRYDCAIR